MRKIRFLTFAFAAVGVATLAPASVLSLNLREMLEIADSAVLGTITKKVTWRGPLLGFEDGADFTTLTVEGEDLVKGGHTTRDVTYLGTDVNPVSEMPAEADTRIGSRVVVFSNAVKSEWGGRKGLNSLIAAEGGVFRVEAGPKGEVVVGRGEGFAVQSNVFATDLRKKIATELAEIRRAKK